MNEQLTELAISLRRTIDQAAISLADDGEYGRALRRAVALLWSAHDEIESLQTLVRRHA